MKTKIIILTAAIVFVLSNLQMQAQEKFSLSYKMEKGKAYTFRQDNLIETTQEMGGQEMKMSTDENSTVKYEVENVSEEGMITLVYSYSEAKLRMKGMGRDTTMDMKNMLGKKTRMKLTQTGRIIFETPTDTSKNAKSSNSLNMFASENLPRLPEKSVGIGEKWPGVSNDTTRSSEGQVVYKKNLEYTLTGKENKGNHECLKIDFKGSIEMSGTMNQMGMGITLEGTGETSGSFWFDTLNGMMVETSNVTAIEMTMAVTGQQQMTIPMSQKVTSVKKLTE